MEAGLQLTPPSPVKPSSPPRLPPHVVSRGRAPPTNVSDTKLPLRVCSPTLGSRVSGDERLSGGHRTAPSGPCLEFSLGVKK